jgi:hypothetical protein
MNDYDNGKKFAQEKILELMGEVIHEYKMQQIRMEGGNAKELQAKVNAVEFMKHWALSGGTEDEDGNRVCLVW